MTDPVEFTSITPRFKIPLLFTAQAQKEFYVNEAHSLVDGLLHPTVRGEASAPPADALDGQSWLVGSSATGAFATHENSIATLQSGQWLFITPVRGMSVFDETAGKRRYFDGSWVALSAIAPPAGGGVQDTQARTSIAQIITALQKAGIVPIT